MSKPFTVMATGDAVFAGIHESVINQWTVQRVPADARKWRPNFRIGVRYFVTCTKMSTVRNYLDVSYRSKRLATIHNLRQLCKSNRRLSFLFLLTVFTLADRPAVKSREVLGSI